MRVFVRLLTAAGQVPESVRDVQEVLLEGRAFESLRDVQELPSHHRGALQGLRPPGFGAPLDDFRRAQVARAGFRGAQVLPEELRRAEENLLGYCGLVTQDGVILRPYDFGGRGFTAHLQATAGGSGHRRGGAVMADVFQHLSVWMKVDNRSV